MTDLPQFNRKFLLAFTELAAVFYVYVQKTKCREYNDRIKKYKAYGQILVQIKEVYGDATKETVKKKIDILRAGKGRIK